MRIHGVSYLDFNQIHEHHATGNNFYLEKILNYINEDDFILIAAYETLNRKYLCQVMTKLGDSSCQHKSNVSDIIASIHKKYPQNYQQMLNKVITCASALWSLESNRQQDPMVDKKITEIIQKNPRLDYWKKINQAIK